MTEKKEIPQKEAPKGGMTAKEAEKLGLDPVAWGGSSK